MRVSETVFNWWQSHLKSRDFDSAPRAFRAQLRCSTTSYEVLADARVISLAQDLKLSHDLPRLITLVRILAAAKDYNSQPLARKLGAKTGETRVMSELRFRRLLRAEQGSELEATLIRALRTVEGSCNLGRLGEDIYWWSDETRNRWCFEYYGTSVPEPLATLENDFEETT